MSRTLRLAALQLRAHDRADYERLQESMIRRIERAAEGHDLLVLPEGTFPAYVLTDAAVDERSVRGATEQLARIARTAHCAIVAGAAVHRDGKLYNSAIVIDRDGNLAGSAEKIFLWHFDRQWFSAGSAIAPVQTSIGRLGVLICADGRMPGIARELVDRGAELLVMPTAWVTSGRDPHQLENLQADLLGRVRAFENGAPFIAANKCGFELGMVAYCGKSQIVDARGQVVVMGSQTQEEVLSARVEIDAAQPYRAALPAPTARALAPARALRMAIAIEELPADLTERLRVLEVDLALAAVGPDQFNALDRLVAAVRIDAREAFDPGLLVAYRRTGYRIVILDAATTHPWIERIARARAAELRMYVIVFDRQAQRAYAVDPDGAIVAGTFDGYAMASFALDPGRTEQTLVAPGTDVAAGIEQVAAISRPQASVS